ncbi:MAG TPA: hypothetical protein VFE58_08155 [Tepidisphaeraceae bacterium]|nr:hypothetical protein [Tepidisphaeraceae bacterium]
MITSLNAFKSHPYTQGDVASLYAITAAFNELPDKLRVVPAIFALMERCPEADLGTPGPLVHALESLGIPAYEAQLAESVRRRPMYTNVGMVTSILNVERDPVRRGKWIKLLREACVHPAAADTIEQISRYFAGRAIPVVE